MHIRVSDRRHAGARGARARARPPGTRAGRQSATRPRLHATPQSTLYRTLYGSLNNAVRERVRSAPDESDPPLIDRRACGAIMVHARPRSSSGVVQHQFSFASSLCCPMLTSLQIRPVQIAEEGPSIGTHHNNMGAPSFGCAGGHVAQTCNAKQHPRRIRGRLPRLVSPTCHLRRLSSWPWPRPPARQTRTPPLSRMTFPSASRKTRSTSRSTDSGARCR